MRSLPQLQGSESNRRGPAYEAGLGASTRPAKKPIGARGGNRTRLAGLEGRCLMPIGHACVVSAQRELNPLLRTGKPACSLEHLGRVGAPGRTRTGMKTVLQTAAYPFSPPER